MLETIFYCLGAIAAALLAVLAVGTFGGLFLGLVAYKGNFFLLPSLTFFLLEKLRPILKFLFSFVSRDRFLVERMAIKVLNHMHHRRFAAVPVSERVAILPQCLRDLDCTAGLSPELGLACKRCGKCVIDKVFSLLDGNETGSPENNKNEGEAINKVYISPGGTFAARILEAVRPKAVVGVACPRDLFEGLSICHSRGIPAQGVLLLRDGCVATEVDFEKLSKVILAKSGKENAT